MVTAQCPHKPGGRLEADSHLVCPVPGRIGIVADEQESVISWAFRPQCISQAAKNDSTPRIDCLFTSADFRNGHGISMVTSTTIASNLIGLDAFSDQPKPLAPHQPRGLEPAYTMVPVAAKGMALIASRKIRRGEIIMTDVPSMLIAVSFLADTKAHHRRRVIKNAIKQLPEQTRAKIHGLNRGASNYEIDAILGPNSNTIMLADEAYVGLFAEVAVCTTLTEPARMLSLK